MNRKEAEKYFKRVGGREGISIRCLEICKEIVESGSYKRAMAGAGQLKLLAEAALKSDAYWAEITNRGLSREKFYLENQQAIKPLLDDEGKLSREHFEAEREHFNKK